MESHGVERQDSVAAALSQVGDRWTFLILRESFFGVRRFADFQRNLGVARNILSDRLGKLVEFEILARRRYSNHPPREEYRLTEKGRDLYNVTVALMHWGDKWVVDKPALLLTHRDDGGVVEQILQCTCCRQPITSRDVTYHTPDDHSPSAM
ncbi:helix-turn-helix domain-containing protein [Rhodococcus sp. IEGM 1409]|uniref:winged helix-turn-helix transcriptional regulator n=1 Tax=Rhodococcus sp. IEGM 1409 TaxID=3047082 RepID=UPI0024B6536B|nr:helix-turn-helix domain-containing protein [Rhodococcus sp. IEGM 1409]MDI9903527.1 helix-turn-helix domain-containing protein [Rhodococcus sp. IEGM 1409]